MKKTKIRIRKYSFVCNDPVESILDACQKAAKDLQDRIGFIGLVDKDTVDVLTHANKLILENNICTLIWEEEIPVDPERIKRHNKFKYASYNKRKVSCLSSKISL